MSAPRMIVITGASSGIGAALARHYAAQGGTRLALLGRDAERLASVASDCRAAGCAAAETVQADVRDRAAMHDILTQLDARTPIDLLVANAGISTGLATGMLIEDPEAVRGIVAINFLGVLNTVEPLLGPMIARRRGRIAMTGSIAALRGLPYSPAYCATKAAVHLYAESLRGTLRGHRVGVSLIVPGFVHTPMNTKLGGIKPLAMTDTKAARIIAAGLDRGRATIAFPRSLYWVTRLSAFLPAFVADPILTRIQIDVPVTRERAL
jgi:short-subunit dehydrogenase